MMRILFWILLLGNVAFFAVMHWEGAPVAGKQVPQAQFALHEEKISLLSELQSRQVAASAVDNTPPAAKQNVSCLEWGEFSGADLARATAVLSELQLGDKSSQRQIERNIGYWVYIPPVKDKAAIARKIVQLKARGIMEYFVVPEAGPWQNAISLGVFKTQEAAQNFLDDLRSAKGVQNAQMGERASKLRMIVFLLSGVDAATESRLNGVQKDFPGSELKNVPCTHIDKAE